MAQFTMELRKLVESGYNIFDDTWDTHIHAHKPVLCDKIIRRYYFNEIGAETPDRFKHYLNEHLARIMPYYNQLYASELLQIEPLIDHCIELSGDTRLKRLTDKNSASRSESDRIRELTHALNRLINFTSNLNGVHVGHDTEDWSEHKTGQQNETTETDRDIDVESQEQFTGKEVYSGEKDRTENTTENTSEHMQDDVTGTKDSNTESSTTTSSTRRHSDTPQGQIDQNGQLGIDARYLTDYVHENGQSSTTATAHESLKNNEIKDTETNTTKDVTEKQTESYTKDNTSTTDSTSHTDDTEHGTKDINYSEDKNGDKTVDTKLTDTEDQVEKQTQDDMSIDTERNRDSDMRVGTENEDERQSQVRKDLSKGFMQAQSVLLEQYRKTFLNIDEKIVEELSINFMGVF